MSSPLVLGPLLRHVDRDSATIWVQTSRDAMVRVRCNGAEFTTPTFRVHRYHYALVIVDGLEQGQVLEYAVDIDGDQVWPEPGSTFPPSRIATLEDDKPSRIAFGSCRTSSSHDEAGNERHGVDALRAYGVHMLEREHTAWPDIFCFLGDQVYADEETPPELRAFMEARRSLDEPPGEEIKDYVEYTEVYRLAWSDPVVRWLLSTVPSTMIFDDHDVRDDWNTSWRWQREIRQEPWWQERIVSALASYWVYQHIGNLAPSELAGDELWQYISRHTESGATDELDITEELEALADRADKQPETYRWSYTRDLGDSQLVVIDSRAARMIDPNGRSMLDAEEWHWLDERLRGDTRYLFIGSSLPVLLPPGLHDFEAMSETIVHGSYGRLLAAGAEKVRRTIDLEHWAAFNDGFVDLMESVMAVARGERGKAPQVISFLSGDVHNSYLAEVTDPQQYGARSRIVQAVCSPMRNPMPQAVRVFMSLFARSLVKPMRALVGRSSRMPDPAYPWSVTRGPWFENNVAICEAVDDGLEFRWFAGEDVDDDLDRPTLRTVARVRVRA